MNKKLHNFNTLPKWANNIIDDYAREIHRLNSRLTEIQNMNAVMCEPERDWFTLPFSFDNYDIVHLWLLDKDQPIPVCALTKGDLLFVGRAKKEVENDNAKS